jgi:3-hydroxy acid dehydrogenase / malonic semialdehyde reductase
VIDPAQLTVFVTGATSGFGEATARRFSRAGAKVVITGRRVERLDKLLAELGDERTHAAALDVRDRRAVERVVAELPEKFRDVDVLVNNAGLALDLTPAHQANIDDWDVMIDTNVKGLVYVTRTLLPSMVQRDRGHVINVGSVAGTYSYPGGNVYGATKAFVASLAMHLRADLLGANVRVTSIEPGLCGETEFSLVRFKGDAARAANVYQGVDPLTGEDIAESIYWCATLPRHVNVNRMELMPVMQSFGPLAVKRRP